MPSKSAVDPKIVEELTRLRKQVTAVGYVAFPQVHLLPHKRCLEGYMAKLVPQMQMLYWGPTCCHASRILNGTSTTCKAL